MAERTGVALVTRQATADDAAQIVRHRRLMFESMGVGDPARNDAMDAAALAYLPRAIETGEYLGWMVVAPDGEVVGGAGLSVMRLLPTPFNPGGQFTYLMSLYVEPAFRRQGIAGRLIETMVEWSRAHGYGEVRLHASDQGRRLYERLGFRETNEMRLRLPE